MTRALVLIWLIVVAVMPVTAHAMGSAADVGGPCLVVPLRGIGSEGAALRRNIALADGRMFQPGSNEIVVGKALVREFQGFEVGSSVMFGTSSWRSWGCSTPAGGCSN